MSIMIRVKNLSKSFEIENEYKPDTLKEFLTEIIYKPSKLKKKDTEKFWALKNVSFEIKSGEIFGIVGPNGSGKSTLLKLLSRVIEPTSGIAEIYGKVSSLLEVGTGFHPDLTGRENVYLNGAILGMTKKGIKENFDKIVEFSGVEKFIDTPVKHYSTGMYIRLAFSIGVHLDSEVLILDEVLAVGDDLFQKKFVKKIEEIVKEGKTILLVSHSEEIISRFCTNVMLLAEGSVKAIGSSSQVLKTYKQLYQN